MLRLLAPVFATAFFASVPALASEPVAVPHFDSVDLRGGGDVVVVPGPAQRVTILEGSSQFTRIYVEQGRNLKIDVCNGNCPREYRLRVEIQSPNVPALAVDGGGRINVAPGFTPASDLVVAVNGGGQIDTRPVDAKQVTAAVNGGGQLLVRARSALTGAVRGGGLVRYWGNPAVTSAIDGGGAIQRGN